MSVVVGGGTLRESVGADPVEVGQVEVGRDVEDGQALAPPDDVMQRRMDRVRDALRTKDGTGLANEILIEVDGGVLAHRSMICIDIRNVYA